MQIDAAHSRLRRELDKGCLQLVHLSRAQTEFFLGQNDNAAALRCFIRKRAELRRTCKIPLFHTGRGMKGRGHAIAKRDRSRLVEKQHVYVARGFDGASAHRQHVALEDAVHPGDANGAEQSSDGCRDQTNKQRDQNRNRKYGAGVNTERLERDTDQQKDKGQRREQNC